MEQDVLTPSPAERDGTYRPKRPRKRPARTTWTGRRDDALLALAVQTLELPVVEDIATSALVASGILVGGLPSRFPKGLNGLNEEGTLLKAPELLSDTHEPFDREFKTTLCRSTVDRTDWRRSDSSPSLARR